MYSDLFNKIGLGNMDMAYPIIVLAVLCIAMFIYIINLNRKINQLNYKYRKFMSGKEGKSLEKTIVKRFNQVDNLIDLDKETNKKLNILQEDFLGAFQKLGVVKYDAFNEMGGKLSFALALLNKENTGFVLNAMHSREGCYMYVKEIINGKCAIVLGEEEEEAVNKAINSDNYMI